MKNGWIEDSKKCLLKNLQIREKELKAGYIVFIGKKIYDHRWTIIKII